MPHELITRYRVLPIGWDATFSAPKSVSLTALVGGDEALREAHRDSVKVALNEMEKFVQARIGGNRPPETTGKWIAASFEHDSARPVVSRELSHCVGDIGGGKNPSHSPKLKSFVVGEIERRKPENHPIGPTLLLQSNRGPAPEMFS
jgi:hypothetical protein